MSWVLIGACVLVFLWQVSLGPRDGQVAVYALGVIPAILFEGARLPPELVMVPPVATVLTSMFLHGGWMHLIGNMLYLWIFGDNVEDCMGHGRFVVFYLLCGVAAVLAQSLPDTHSQVPVIWASGAISGVLGAYLLLFRDRDVTDMSVSERIRVGIARSFQIANLFDDLSAHDHVALSIFSRDGRTFSFFSVAELDDDVNGEAEAVLGQFGLGGKGHVLAKAMAQGERKLLDVAVAYALRPKFIFLDEPTSGVSTRDKARIMETITCAVRDGGVTAAVIEHDMDIVFQYADRIVVMADGRILADGTPDEIRSNKDVESVFLGST